MAQSSDEAAMRSFIAIELPDNVRRFLRQQIEWLKLQLPGSFRWVAPESIHLTLKFLGNVPTGQASDIVKAMGMAAQGTAPFQLRTGEFGCFPTPRRARVLWVGLEGEVEALARLQSGLEAGLQPLGFPGEDRPFVPHLTLARARDRGPTPDAEQVKRLIACWPGGREEFTAVAVSLMKSTLTPQGAMYDRVASVGLGGE